MAYVGNAVFSPPQIETYQVMDFWFTPLEIRCGNGGEGHLRTPAVVAYENVSDDECDRNARSLTEHIRGRLINPVKFVCEFGLRILIVLGPFLLTAKRAYVLEKEAKIGA